MDNNLKVVIVVADSLGRGLAANRAAVLATGLAVHVPNMIGQDLVTKDGKKLSSFTQIPIPILSSKQDTNFIELARRSEEIGCKVIVFLTRAQGMRSYEEYRLSVAIYGDAKSVTKVTGNLPSLR